MPTILLINYEYDNQLSHVGRFEGVYIRFAEAVFFLTHYSVAVFKGAYATLEKLQSTDSNFYMEVPTERSLPTVDRTFY